MFLPDMSQPTLRQKNSERISAVVVVRTICQISRSLWHRALEDLSTPPTKQGCCGEYGDCVKTTTTETSTNQEKPEVV